MTGLRAVLNQASYEQVLELAAYQRALIDEIRGYKAGMTKEHLTVFTKKELIDAFIKNEDTFNLNTAQTMLDRCK